MRVRAVHGLLRLGLAREPIPTVRTGQGAEHRG